MTMVTVDLEMTGCSSMQQHDNSSSNCNRTSLEEEIGQMRWGMLGLFLLILATSSGNILVCLAVTWERRLQNMTNYFLMSLAIADLLVSLLVMPLAMVVELFGYFPLGSSLCVIWATMDVLLCTASIWHMCTMSMDRYFTIRYPIKYGRNKTKKMVILKITFVWIVSFAVSVPLAIAGFVNHSNVYTEGKCMPSIKNFILYGSIFAFFVPLVIMVSTYTLTIRILRQNRTLMSDLSGKYRVQVPVTTTVESNAGRRNDGLQTVATQPYNYTTMAPSHADNGLLSPRKTGFTIDTSARASSGESPRSPETQKFICRISDRQPEEEQLTFNFMDNDDVINRFYYRYDDLLVQVKEKNDSNAALRQLISKCSDDSEARRSKRKISKAFSQSTISDLNDRHPAIFCRSSRSHSDLRSIYSERFELNPFKLENCHLNCEEAMTDLSSRSSQPPSFSSFPPPPPPPLPSSSIDTKREPSFSSKYFFLDCCLDGAVDSQLASHLFRNDRNYANVHISSANNFKQVISETNRTVNNDGNDVSHFKSKQQEKNKIKMETETEIPWFLGSKDSPMKRSFVDNSANESSVTSKDGSSFTETNHYLTTAAAAASREAVGLRMTAEEMNNFEEETRELLTITLGSNNSRNRLSDRGGDFKEETRALLSTDNRNISSTPSWSKRSPSTDTSPSRSDCNRTFIRTSQAEIMKRSKVRACVRRISHLSKNRSTNERKASKVLGIIFAVFVFSWTPFFTMNIISVLCESCMETVTDSMMASLVWLGYLSSLANPIIYTMFSTSFRTVFFRILTCHYRSSACSLCCCCRYHRSSDEPFLCWSKKRRQSNIIVCDSNIICRSR